ncbi:Mitochondrial uncoupling protein 6 [Hibiscus syriacus]|uniref:Mitochondrial uncoupling protein 6 n=1 Tax=Hibiscus syriacus TaxID=106335 RepID=A0A6A2YDA2_HIBSY|nr:Mitochondrial uncoupling protein 6 [Hibiscus syriacus]
MGLKGFVEGGIASIVAGASTHPLDLIKVRMQLQGESHLPNPSLQAYRPALALNSAAVGNVSISQAVSQPRVGPVSIGVRIIQSEGVAALFSGVSATILRQTLYSTTRMDSTIFLKKMDRQRSWEFATYEQDSWWTYRRWHRRRSRKPGRRSDDDETRRRWRLVGGLGAHGEPCDDRHGIATRDVRSGEGVMGDGIGTHVTASFSAGFVAAVASNPIDVLKTRVMNMKVAPGAEPPYSGAIDCALKTVREEGPMALY